MALLLTASVIIMFIGDGTHLPMNRKKGKKTGHEIKYTITHYSKKNRKQTTNSSHVLVNSEGSELAKRPSLKSFCRTYFLSQDFILPVLHGYAYIYWARLTSSVHFCNKTKVILWTLCLAMSCDCIVWCGLKLLCDLQCIDVCIGSRNTLQESSLLNTFLHI